MRSHIAIFLSVLMATSAVAQQQQNLASAIAECSNEPGSTRPSCNVSKNDAKKAKKHFEQGLAARKKKDLRSSFENFREAARLNPASAEYITAREVMKQQLMYELLQKANDDIANGHQVEAMAAVRYAMEVDPANTFAQQKILTMLPEFQRSRPPLVGDKLHAAMEVHAQPEVLKQDFKYRGSSRELLEYVAKSYGLTASIDDSVKPRQVRMQVQGVDFATAISIATRLTGTFWTPLSSDRILFATDNDQNRRALERTALRTFYVPEATSPQAINDLVNVMRVLFDVRFITQQASNATISVRAPSPVLDAISEWLETLSDGRPQVSLEIDVFTISHTYARQIGIKIPPTFSLFNIPTEAAKLLGNQSVQEVINQLIASGAINQANTTAIAALVAQFLAQQGGSSLLSSPFAIFGGGITLMGLTLPGSVLRFSAQESDIQTLQHLTLRAAQGAPATMKIGERYPILTSSYAPIFNTAAISQVLQNQTYQAPFPSFNYEDLGVNLKATPQIHRDTDVTLDLEMQLRVLGTQSVNGVPIISNREYKGAITLKNGEPAVLAGMVNHTDSGTVNGSPWLGRIPIVGLAFSEHDKNKEDSELLIVITPHITRMVDAKGPLQLTMPSTGQK